MSTKIKSMIVSSALIFASGASFMFAGWHSGSAEKLVAANALPAVSLSAETGAATGSVQGRVIFEGLVPKPQKLLVVKDVEVCSKIGHSDERLIVGPRKGIQNAVIALIGVQGGKPMSALGSAFVLDQKACRYTPHVLVVAKDSTVEILNSDGVLHNIHTFSKINRPVNLAHPKAVPKLKIAFKKPEKVAVKCDIHGWMSAWIVVAEHPYYAVTDANGAFVLSDVPPGTYAITSWQEALGEQNAVVTVTPGGTATIDFVYTGKKKS